MNTEKKKLFIINIFIGKMNGAVIKIGKSIIGATDSVTNYLNKFRFDSDFINNEDFSGSIKNTNDFNN